MMAIINNSTGSSNTSSTANSKASSSCSSSSSSTTSCIIMEDENVICPLCMENLDIDDRSFYPCTCGYQICRFCWHRIRSESDDQNGLCPACRKQYSENPANFKPLSTEDIQKLKIQKRQKDQQKKQKSENGKRHLADLRVVQKNLVFVVGISPRIADPDVLKKNEFFGKFGKIHKVVVNPCLQGTTASAYITYIRSEDALRAIQSVNNIPFDGKTIKVSLGTTKYCSHFMRNQICPKSECMYLHHYGDAEASFTKEDMQAGKHQEYEKKLLEEFNTHQNNNNEMGTGFSKDNRGSTKRITTGSGIQQGVSYSTKLLVNSTPPQQPTPASPPPPSQSPSSSSTTSSHHPPSLPDEAPAPEQEQLDSATELLASTRIHDSSASSSSSNLDEEEEDFHDALLKQDKESPVVVNPEPEPLLEQNNLDLDFDPFHETQKAFEQIINEQVRVDSGNAEQSLLRRFIQPREEETGAFSSGNVMGFHQQQTPHHQVPQQQQQPHSSHVHMQQQLPSPTVPYNSNILDFFTSSQYAYKQQLDHHRANIPPPPGFQQQQQQQELKRTGHWIDESTAADWMSLDPAIIFSKTSNDRVNKPVFLGDNPLVGLFGGQQQHDRVFGSANQQVFCQQQQQNNIPPGHPLLRPTPTTTTASTPTQPQLPAAQSPYYNGMNYFNGMNTQQQQQLPQQQRSYFPQQRYYNAQQQTPQQQQQPTVTPPPPGFGVGYKQFGQFHQQQQQHHNGSSFFPF